MGSESRDRCGGQKVEVKGISPGTYRVRIYHTWKGVFQDTVSVPSVKGVVSFNIPALQMEQHANYIGPDVALIVEAEDKER